MLQTVHIHRSEVIRNFIGSFPHVAAACGRNVIHFCGMTSAKCVYVCTRSRACARLRFVLKLSVVVMAAVSCFFEMFLLQTGTNGVAVFCEPSPC